MDAFTFLKSKKCGAFFTLISWMFFTVYTTHNNVRRLLLSEINPNDHSGSTNDKMSSLLVEETTMLFGGNRTQTTTPPTPTITKKPLIAIVSCIRHGKPRSAFAAAGNSSTTLNTSAIATPTALEEILLPSLLRTITKKEWETFRVEVVLGYDKGDEYWENPANRQQARDSIPATVPLAIHFLSIIKEPENRPHRIPFNELCRATYQYGADYIVRVNDDSKFTSRGWITLATQRLAQYDPPNVGVVGPTCHQGNGRILTHDMVHRTHLDIFIDYYPPIFDNWYVDDWISLVYGENRTTKLPNWTITHLVNKYGTRYKIAREQKSLLEQAVADGQLYLHMYLKDNYTPVLGTYRLAHVEGPMRPVHEQLLAGAAAAAAAAAATEAQDTTFAVNSSITNLR